MEFKPPSALPDMEDEGKRNPKKSRKEREPAAQGVEPAVAELLTVTTQDTRQHLPLKTLNTAHSCLAR